MKIHDIEIKPGMVIKTIEDVTYVAFPMTAGGVQGRIQQTIV